MKKKPLVSVKCEFCGTYFTTKNCRRKRRFCSKSCAAKHTSVKRGFVLGGSHKRNDIVSIPSHCAFCGKYFVVTNKYRPQRFCSKSCGSKNRHLNCGNTKEATEKRITEFIRRKGRFCSYSEIQKELHITDKTFSHWGIKYIDLNEKEGYFKSERIRRNHLIREALLSGKYHCLSAALKDLGFSRSDVDSHVVKVTELLKSINVNWSNARYPTKEDLETAIIAEIKKDGAQIPSGELVRRLHFDYSKAIKNGIRMIDMHRRAGVKYSVTTSYFELVFYRKASIVFDKVFQQYKFNDCRSPITGRSLTFDFYIEDACVLVEIDGDQHRRSNHIYHSKKLEVHDSVKDMYSKSKGIRLVRIPVTPKASFDSRVDDIIDEIKSGSCKTH